MMGILAVSPLFSLSAFEGEFNSLGLYEFPHILSFCSRYQYGMILTRHIASIDREGKCLQATGGGRLNNRI